jgi:hypothetical protein
MITVAQRFWRSGPSRFEWPSLEQAGMRRLAPGRPIKHYGRPLAHVINWQLEYLQWAAHDPDQADGTTETLILRMGQLLLRDRWGLPPDEQQILDQSRFALTAILSCGTPDEWDIEAKAYRVDPERQKLFREALREHPYLIERVREARRQLKAEYRVLQRRARKLQREMEEGVVPLHERLRKTVDEWRDRDLLPKTPPIAS